MGQKEFKITLSCILLPIAAACFYFGLKDFTIPEIVDMAEEKCENIPDTDAARAYCMLGYVNSYCDKNWKNEYCHEYQLKNLKK